MITCEVARGLQGLWEVAGGHGLGAGGQGVAWQAISSRKSS